MSDSSPKELGKVCALLESRDADKIQEAIASLESHPDQKASVEARYLPFIRTRTKDAKAGLDKISEASLSESEVDTFLKNMVDKRDVVNFGMVSDEECRMMVDFIGAVVQFTVKADEYLEETSKASKRPEMIKYTKPLEEQLRNDLRHQKQVYSKGWFGQCLAKMSDMYVRSVMFDHTGWEDANESPVLREFWLYIGLKGNKVHLDIFQSTAPNLTEVFWALPRIPGSGWGDTSPEFPKSKLAYERKVQYKIGDDGRWQWISSLAES